MTLEPIQSGTGTPSPDNVRPISGHTEVNTQRTGKNLLDKSKVKKNDGVNRFFKYGVNNYADTTPNGDCILGIGTYTFSIQGDSTTNAQSISVLDADWNRIGIAYNNKALTFTVQEKGEYIIAFNFGGIVDFDSYNLQLEKGSSTATDYEPYESETYTTDLGQTVYGGTLDVVSGELVVDRAMVDLGTLNWRISSSRMLAQNLSPTAKSIGTSIIPNAVCSQYEPIRWAWVDVDHNGTFCVTVNQIIVMDSRFTDPVEFKTAMNGVQLVYELAAPQTIQLTPQQVMLLTGDNNVWSDGQVTMVYSADVARWVEKKLNS